MTGLATLGLRLEEECAVNHDLFTGAQSREDFDFTGQVTSATNAADLKRALTFRQEDAPVVPDSLKGRDRHAQDGST